jgi:starch phosphorylase
VHVTHVESSGVGDAPQLGQQLEVRAVVELGALSPDDVVVQVACGAVDDEDQLRDPHYVDMQRVGDHGEDGSLRYEGLVPLERRGAFGYTVRVLPRHPSLVSPAELALIALPAESSSYTEI